MYCLIGFSTGRSFTSKAIRFFRKSQYSHTFEIVGQLSNDLVCVEAAELGVRLAPLHKHVNKDSKVEIWKIKVDESKFHQAVRNAMCRVAHAYGFLQLIGFIWVWAWELIGIKKDNPFHDGIICSEEVLMFLKDCEYQLVMDMPPNKTAPDDILSKLNADKDAEVVAYKDFDEDILHWTI